MKVIVVVQVARRLPLDEDYRGEVNVIGNDPKARKHIRIYYHVGQVQFFFSLSLVSLLHNHNSGS